MTRTLMSPEAIKAAAERIVASRDANLIGTLIFALGEAAELLDAVNKHRPFGNHGTSVRNLANETLAKARQEA